MKYSQQDIMQGSRMKDQANETPSSFSTIDSASIHSAPDSFGKSRMAGPVGERALQLMNDPLEAKRTMGWMKQFGLSNEGFQFNQAKMMMSGTLPQPQQEEQQKGEQE